MKAFIQELLQEAGITINGTHPWDIIVHDEQFYKRLMKDPDLALGETYMEGMWDCLRVDQCIYKILMAKLDKKILHSPHFWRFVIYHKFSEIIHKVFNFQSKEKSLEVGYKHYDIGNDLYHAMLDKRMVYTCGYWDYATNLDDAQEAKLHLTCQKLGLKPGMRLLDIGCGFGSLIKFAAENYGVSAVGITISKQQYESAKLNCSNLPIEIRLQDYRDLLTEIKSEAQKFDRIASLGMFEHVGHKNYELYMKVVAHCLKDDGLFLLHTIGSNVSHNICESNFICKYIFPNGLTPSIAQIGDAIENKFIMEDWHNFGVDYDKTLMAWYHNFNRHWDKLKHHYDERFRRMWNYYLLSCAASFRARQIQLWQIVLTQKGLAEGFQYKRCELNQSLKSNCRQAS